VSQVVKHQSKFEDLMSAIEKETDDAAEQEEVLKLRDQRWNVEGFG
jgi:hypothetical protein